MITTDTIISSLYYPILLSFSLSLVLPKVINIFKNNMHSLFTFTNGNGNVNVNANTTEFDHHRRSVSGLVTATEDSDRLPNVLESTTLNTMTKNKRNNFAITLPSPIGFISGDVDGLMSCTESLGFESSDERRVDDRIDIVRNDNEKVNDDNDVDEVWRRRLIMKRAEGRGKLCNVRSFPPPLSSLNRNGKPSFYLRPVRKDGRLELTEVRIHRPEILHASRHDGRLTLHLIPDQPSLEEEEEYEEEEQEFVQENEEEQELVVQEEEEEEVVVVEEEEEEEISSRGGEWGYSGGVGSNNEGLRRCHEMVNNHQHNHLPMCGISIV